MISKYLAITLGPIKKTMSFARKTREFWAASMLFSLLAKELCDQLQAEKISKKDFLVPHPEVFERQVINVGLYLDRIICKVPDANFFEELDKSIIRPALEKLCQTMNLVPEVNFTVDDLVSYFNIYAICMEAEDAKPLGEISHHLNTLELFSKETSTSLVSDKIKRFLENVNTEYEDKEQVQNSTFLDHFFFRPDFKGNNRIPSIVEVTTVAFQRLPEKGSAYRSILNKHIWIKDPKENNLFPALKEQFGEEFRNFHKYFCILQADGDHLGTTLLGSDSKTIHAISGDLIEWGKSSLATLVEYGALPIYIGGDDLLCFAPVSNGKESILDLADKLNSTYNQMENLAGKSTLRVGIKISYFKSPMYEAYEETFSLLDEAAKIRNACCINLEKHSGQPHQFCFSFDKEFRQFIHPLLETMTGDKNDKNFLTSVIYKLAENEELFALIANTPERVWAFLQNNLEEAKERDGKPVYPQKHAFLKGVVNYMVYLFGEHKMEKDETSQLYKATVQLYSALKSIRFIKGLDDDKDE